MAHVIVWVVHSINRMSSFVNLMLHYVPYMHMLDKLCAGQLGGMPASLLLGSLPLSSPKPYLERSLLNQLGTTLGPGQS